MKFSTETTTNEGWGGLPQPAGYKPIGTSGEYIAGQLGAGVAQRITRRHLSPMHKADSTVTVVGPYSQTQTIKHIT